MAHDLAKEIVERAEALEESENTSILKLFIQGRLAVAFDISKNKKFVKISNPRKRTSIKIQSNSDSLKQIWKLLIQDEVQNVLRDPSVIIIDKGIAAAWQKAQGSPIALFEGVTKTISMASALGFGKKYVSSMVEAQERINGIELVPKK